MTRQQYQRLHSGDAQVYHEEDGGPNYFDDEYNYLNNESDGFDDVYNNCDLSSAQHPFSLPGTSLEDHRHHHHHRHHCHYYDHLAIKV